MDLLETSLYEGRNKTSCGTQTVSNLSIYDMVYIGASDENTYELILSWLFWNDDA